MTRSGWEVETGDDPPVEDGKRALAYRADDGALALYNDYERFRSIVRTPKAPGAGGVRPAPVPGAHALAEAAEVAGYGTFTFPYGPISAGVPEAGKFEVRTYGERVLGLVPVGGFKSRSVPASVVGLPVADAGLRVERIAGNLSASHVSAFLAAVESAEGRPVPTAELYVRALAQELQRLYNHVRQIARVAEAAAQNVGLAQMHALGEEILRLQGSVFGHRWMFGALLPGGPARRVEPADRDRIEHALGRIEAEFGALWSLLLESRTFVDRLQSTAPLSKEAAISSGAVGPTLRASGVGWDDRLRAPTPPYTDLFVSLPNETAGDALARILVRGAEIQASLVILEQLFDRWPAEESITEAPESPLGPGRGIARVEAPNGDLVYDVTVADGRIRRLQFRSPSTANWPAFALSMQDAVFTDFHFAFESFGLVFAETDG